MGGASLKESDGTKKDVESSVKAANDAAANVPITAISDSNNRSPKSREEGEISSSDEEETAAGSPSLFTSGTAVGKGPAQVSSESQHNQDIQSGKFASANNFTSSTGICDRNIAPSEHQKSYEKTQGSFVPFLISFSDDDSSSDSDFSEGKRLENKGSVLLENRNGRPPFVVPKKPRTWHLSDRNKINVSSESSLSRARVFPNTINDRITLSRKNEPNQSMPLMVEQNFCKRNFSAVSKFGQHHGDSQQINLNSSKLTDLRQLIAARKNELKRKYIQQKKEQFSNSCRDHEAMNLKSDTSFMQRVSYADSLYGEVERKHKCVKLDETLSNPLSLTVQQDMPTIQPTIVLENSALEKKFDQQQANDCDSHEKEVTLYTQLSSFRKKKQDENEGPASSIVLPRGGIQVFADSNLHDENLKSPTHIGQQSTNGGLNIQAPESKQSADTESLLEIEQLLDQELEQAQEHRRKCEIEERNAHKAYRKAQKDLIEANARCSQLYLKRELVSIQFRSHLMEMSGADMHLIPTSSHKREINFDVHNHCGHDTQTSCHVAQNSSAQGVDKKNVVSESPGGPAPIYGVDSPSNDLFISTHEDEATFQFNEISPPHNQNYQVHKNLNANKGKITNNNLDKSYCDQNEHVSNIGAGGDHLLDTSQDSLVLEASLRSQLFERMGMKTFSKKKGKNQNTGPVGIGSSCAASLEKLEKLNLRHLPVQVDGRDDHSALQDNEETKRNSSEILVEVNNQLNTLKLFNCASLSTTDQSGKYAVEDHQPQKPNTFLSPVLRSLFGHIKMTCPRNLDDSREKNQDVHSFIANEISTDVCLNEVKPTIFLSDILKQSAVDKYASQVGLYTCNSVIDPFWPLCMFELRGKCNNDECSWQHFGDTFCRELNDVSGGQNQQSQKSQIIFARKNPSECSGGLAFASPTYQVYLDALKVDLHLYNSRLVQNVGQQVQKCFSAALALSNLLPKDLPVHGSFICTTEKRIEVFGGWNRQSSYFYNKSTMSECDKNLADGESLLETSILILIREANELKGRSEAAKVLARGLEVDPTSVNLWIVYLLVYYSNQKSLGKDDMFFCSVEFNEGSYELWLMYINSRGNLDERFAAYERAILALCHHASSLGDAVYDSECILDLFLQMMHCSYISGKGDAALRKFYFLSSSVTESVDTPSPLLLDILMHLTIHDKCLLWICCVYLVVYKKLPDVIVAHFEYHKELTPVQWPFAFLTADEKQQGLRLMGTAVDSLALYIDSESLGSEITLRAAHMFALNHISCISVLEGLECSRELMDKYIKMYPSCLELVLLSARMQENDHGDVSSTCFQDALDNWPDDVPGIQCLWNQYAEYALEKGRLELVKGLMDGWFHTVWEVKYNRRGTLDSLDCENFIDSSELFLPLDSSGSVSTCHPVDFMFGLINLSLYKLLQNDYVGSQLAIDKALKVASADYYKHCVREHVIFLHKNILKHDGHIPFGVTLNILDRYLVDSRSFPALEPMSRKFIWRIKKSRVMQLVSTLLIPLSSDFSLVNLILEQCYGPSLLPKTSKNLKDLVDFVEAIMEITPSNYELAFSLCDVLITCFNSHDLSASVYLWASLLIVNALFQAVPVAPEYIWVKAADILNNLTDNQFLTEHFHNRALTLHPFSIKLWKSLLNLSQTMGNSDTVIERANKVGIEL